MTRMPLEKPLTSRQPIRTPLTESRMGALAPRLCSSRLDLSAGSSSPMPAPGEGCVTTVPAQQHMPFSMWLCLDNLMATDLSKVHAAIDGNQWSLTFHRTVTEKAEHQGVRLARLGPNKRFRLLLLTLLGSAARVDGARATRPTSELTPGLSDRSTPIGCGSAVYEAGSEDLRKLPEVRPRCGGLTSPRADLIREPARRIDNHFRFGPSAELAAALPAGAVRIHRVV